jgi:hypothetical protein
VDEKDAVSLRDYFERVLKEHERMHAQLAEGISVARAAQDRRLDAMNEFRAALSDTANRSVSREVFDAHMKEHSNRLAALERSQVSEDTVANLRQDQDRQRSTMRLAVAGVVLGVAANFIINLIQGASP